MYMIQIQDNKAEELKEHAYKMLKHGKKLYECIEEICEDDAIGERGGYGRYGNRGGYGNRMGYRDDWEDDEDFGQRRGVRGTGRYSRYR